MLRRSVYVYVAAPSMVHKGSGVLGHGLYCADDEGTFFVVKTVFVEELAVDVVDALGPVDVGGRGEVLEGNKAEFVFSYMLCRCYLSY